MSFKIGDGGREVGDFTDFLNRKFASYSNIKRDEKYGLDEARVVAEAMRRYGLAPTFMDVVINGQIVRVEGAIATDEFLTRAGWRPAAKPIIFTVEGHMSNMFLGPCADVARTLEAQGVCHWKPIGYNSTALPFDNPSGVRALAAEVGSHQVAGPPGVWWPFPPGTPWGVIGFSQGAMIVSDFMEQQVLKGPLNWRLNDFKRGMAFGNPRRERDKCAPWAISPPSPGTHGIMDKLFVTTGTPLEGRWMENANDEDMFAEVGDDAAGKDQTAIAKIVTENSWWGGEAAILSRIMALFANPAPEAIGAIMAIIDAIVFLAKNPNPHYSTFATPGDIEWMRGVAR